jgi:nucleoside-diphosphate-sugar epimerase
MTTSSPIQIVVTGDKGFIGSAIHRACRGIEQITSLHGIDIIDGKEHDVCSEGMETAIPTGTEAIIHLAAIPGIMQCALDPLRSTHVNVFGTYNMLRAARINGVKRFVLASTAAVLSNVYHEYGIQKREAENICSMYAKMFQGMEIVVARIANVYGPGCGKKDTVIARWLRSERDGRDIVINGDGSTARDFVYIDDVAEFLLCAATSQSINFNIYAKSPKFLYCGSGQEWTLEELAEFVHANIAHDNNKLSDDIDYTPYTELQNTIDILQWKPGVTLQEGIERTRQWIRQEQDPSQSAFSF